MMMEQMHNIAIFRRDFNGDARSWTPREGTFIIACEVFNEGDLGPYFLFRRHVVHKLELPVLALAKVCPLGKYGNFDQKF